VEHSAARISSAGIASSMFEREAHRSSIVDKLVIVGAAHAERCDCSGIVKGERPV
jgi:hypothetical protein